MDSIMPCCLGATVREWCTSNMLVNSIFLFFFFPLQMIFIAVDEIHFHRRRGLPRWERLGHPLDTLTVLACFAWLLSTVPSSYSLTVYASLSIFSCLFVTKDEMVHSKYCGSGEHWLHALLYLMHPLVLLSAGLLWLAGRQQTLTWIHYNGFERKFLLGIMLITLAFGLYQLIYWNFLWSPAISQKKGELTTTSTVN